MIRRLGDLAETLGVTLEGDPDIEISGLAGLDDSAPGDLSFVTGPRYARAFAGARASAYLVPDGFDAGERPVLRSRAPYVDFARLIPLLYPREEPKPGVHPTAVIADDAELGCDVSIAPYVVISERVRIGDRTRVYPHVTIYPDCEIGADCEIHSGAHLRQGVRLGDRCVVQSGAVIGSEGFAFLFTPEGEHIRVSHRSGVQMGDDVEVGANSTIDASHAGQPHYGRGFASTWLGDGVKIDNLVQVGHGTSLGEGNVLCAQAGIAGGTSTGKHVTFGGGAVAAGHMRVGDGALIGGMSAAIGDVEPGAQLLGFPGVDRRLFARIVAAWKRLPGLLKRVRRIEQQLGIDDK
jgi:UDP-3-O-[3-hydroxymyristoyl] glucosamine N-acyltransferase